MKGKENSNLLPENRYKRTLKHYRKRAQQYLIYNVKYSFHPIQRKLTTLIAKIFSIENVKNQLLIYLNSLNLLLSYIILLDQLDINFRQTISRSQIHRVFESNSQIQLLSLIFSAVLLLNISIKNRKSALFIIFPGILSFFLLGSNISLLSLSFIVTFVSIYYEKKYETHIQCFLVILIIFDLIVLSHYFLLTLGVNSPFSQLATLEYDLYCIGRSTSILFVIFFIFSWNSKSLYNYLKKRSTNFNFTFFERQKFSDGVKLHPKKILIVALISAIFWAIFPWLPTINPVQIGFGKDAGKYYWAIMQMDEGQFLGIGPRSLFTYVLFYCYKIFNLDSFYMVNLLPVIINPLLVFSVYHFVNKSSEDEELAALSAVMTSVGFNITVGMHSYFMPNMLGLSLVFFSFGYLFNGLKKKDKSLNFISILLMAPIFYIHSWTFFQYFGVLCIFAVYLIIKKENITRARRVKKGNAGLLKPLLIYIVLVGLLYVLSNIVLSIDDSVNKPQVFVGFKFVIDQFLYSNVSTFNILYKGIMGNSVYLLICLVGSFLLEKNTYFERYLSIFILISTIVYIFSHAVFPEGAFGNYFPSRLLLNYPLGIFSAIALQKLIHSTHISDKSKLYFMLFFIIYMTVYMFRSIYHIIPPP